MSGLEFAHSTVARLTGAAFVDADDASWRIDPNFPPGATGLTYEVCDVSTLAGSPAVNLTLLEALPVAPVVGPPAWSPTCDVLYSTVQSAHAVHAGDAAAAAVHPGYFWDGFGWTRECLDDVRAHGRFLDFERLIRTATGYHVQGS